jgi:hypothetical protein
LRQVAAWKAPEAEQPGRESPLGREGALPQVARFVDLVVTAPVEELSPAREVTRQASRA